MSRANVKNLASIQKNACKEQKYSVYLDKIGIILTIVNMKKLLLTALCALLCVNLIAQNDGALVESAPDSIVASDVASMTQNFAPKFGQTSPMFDLLQNFVALNGNNISLEEQTYPLGKGLFKKTLVVQALEVCPNISKNKVSQAEMPSNLGIEEIDDTGIGLNFGYSVLFVPGWEDNGQLRLNKAGFAYSVGFIASFNQSDRYGTTCDLMAKLGLETCFNRKMGIGFDLLGGYGKSSGDFYFYNSILEDSAPKSIMPYTLWGWKYGGQLWMKTGVSGNMDILLFARLVDAVDPGTFKSEASLYHYNLWRRENWNFGIIVRYRM